MSFRLRLPNHFHGPKIQAQDFPRAYPHSGTHLLSLKGKFRKLPVWNTTKKLNKFTIVDIFVKKE